MRSFGIHKLQEKFKYVDFFSKQKDSTRRSLYIDVYCQYTSVSTVCVVNILSYLDKYLMPFIPASISITAVF